MTIEQAYGRLAAIRADLEAAFIQAHSEQDARFKIINRFLIEVLGWDYESIATEPATESGYIDYLLSSGDGRSLCVIEAKKLGALPINTASTALTPVTVGGQVLKPNYPVDTTDTSASIISTLARSSDIYPILLQNVTGNCVGNTRYLPVMCDRTAQPKCPANERSYAAAKTPPQVSMPMLRAGMDAFARWDGENEAALVAAVYFAMNGARRE